MPPLVDEARRLISAQLHAIRSVQDVAAALGVAPRTLRRRFRTTMGTSVGAYLLRKRIERMKRLLRTTELTAQEIAYEAGYRHASSAARAFKATTGEAMLAYRRRKDKDHPDSTSPESGNSER